MKRTLLFLFLFSFPIFLQAQNISWLWFDDSPRPCLVDSTQNHNQFDYWNLYKTTNNEWDGTLDSTFCGQVNSNQEIDLSTIGTGETFFVRYRFDDNNKIHLLSNYLYSSKLEAFVSDSAAINLGNNCNGNFCTSIITGIEIPDSLGTGTTMRWHETIPSVSTNPFPNFEAYYCLPTENFSSNYLRELIIKVTLDTAIGTIRFSHYEYTELFGLDIFQTQIDIYKNGNDYTKKLYEHSLVLRSNNLYPSSSNIEYVDLIPIPNVDTAITMTIEINPETSLILQPFVELRAAYLLNSTTQRHNYNIINNGGNICFPYTFEVILKNGNHYIHKDGNLEFGGKMACMQFGEGSKLIVGDNAKLDYGFNGVGNLALRSRSSIEIGKNAELHINNNVLLFEYKYDTEPQQIYMTLNEGSKLSFGKLANITNEYSIDGSMKLNIYMKGGEVDLSQLDPNSRNLVNLIYDTPTSVFSQNIKVLGNPIQDNIRISIVNQEATTVTASLISTNGQLVYNKIFEVQKGYDEIQIPTVGTGNGIYFISIQSDEEMFTEKVVIVK